MGWLYNIDSVDGEKYLKIIRLRRLILLSSLLFFSVHIFSMADKCLYIFYRQLDKY